ncbi:hypothetical protein [Burkholderia sp. BCC0322]|uniref:hypothetical protein n=1 Tax=Burkholderia sp. BCC0322 TaxID=2676296 RepID=UPI00158C3374|nr:hypothetical protein [Burkholderia sp. BCC0322]
MKKLLVIATLFKCSFVSAAPCYVGKYIIGIWAWDIKVAIYVSDTLNGKPNPNHPIPFADKDPGGPSSRLMYSLAQNAVNLHQKIYAMECDSNGKILWFAVVRSND